MSVQSPGSEDRILWSSPEDELPTYRAVSIPAVVTLILGLLSALAFAHPLFWALPLVTLAVGAWALATIRRAPQAYVGARLAQAAMVGAVLCGIAAVVVDWRTTALRQRFGRQTADEFIRRVEAGNPERAFLLELDPSHLKGLDPTDLVGTVRQHGAEMITAMYRPLVQLVVDANQPTRATIRFMGIDSNFHDRGEDRVGVLYEMTRPQHPPVFILVQTTGLPETENALRFHWYVSELLYPYRIAARP